MFKLLNAAREGNGWLEWLRVKAARVESRAWRSVMVALIYSFSLAGSFWLAYQFRYDFSVPREEEGKLWLFLLCFVPLKLMFLLVLLQFQGLLSYFSIPDLRRLFVALAASSLLLLGVWWASEGRWAPPRGVVLVDFLISFLALSTLRLVCRVVRERYVDALKWRNDRVRRVGIIGAGDVGASLARELGMKSHLGMKLAAFFDDDPRKWHSEVYNIPIVGPPESLLERNKDLGLEKIVLAMPSATGKRLREVVEILHRVGLPFESVPSVDQLATGQVRVTQFRQIQIEDLLDAPPAPSERSVEMVRGKTVMVTGAGGTLGTELCRQIAAQGPRGVLLVEQCEVRIFKAEQELAASGHGAVIIPIVADILDEARMRRIFESYRPEVVFHAAAHKHAAILEDQPGEAIQNNAVGAWRLAEMAAAFCSRAFILISSSGAGRPGSVLDASRRLGEIMVQGAQAEQAGRTKFVIARVGELVNAPGGLAAALTKQIAEGGPVEIADGNAVCSLLTAQMAAWRALEFAAGSNEGEVAELTAGRRMRAEELACRMIELAGLRPYEEMEIRIGDFAGKREVDGVGGSEGTPEAGVAEGVVAEGWSIVAAPFPSLQAVRRQWAEVEEGLHFTPPEVLRQWLKRVVPEYQDHAKRLNAGGSAEPGRRRPATARGPAIEREKREEIIA